MKFALLRVWIVVLLLLSLSVAAGPPLATAAPATTDTLDQLVGSWAVEVTVVQQDAVFPSLMTFTSDGIVLADEPPMPFETTGHGAWVATSADSADYTFVALIGSESGALSAQITVTGSLQLDAAADTWAGPFNIQVVDADGAEILADTGTFAGTRIAVETAAPAALVPGDKIGAMTVTQGPDPFDLNVPPIAAFCNTNPFFEPGAAVATPGEYTVECAMPPLPQLLIGYGWVSINPERRDLEWAAMSSELYVNDQLVDQSAFGSSDADVPVTGVPGLDANEVVTQELRIWNVVLENLQPGPLMLRWVFHVNEELSDGLTTTPAGTYDVTFKIAVDESLAVEQGAAEPVVLLQPTAEVFDAFNAAMNAHDVDAALALFAEDAVTEFPNQPPPNLYTGTDELRTWLESDIANNIQVEVSDVKTAGDTVTAIAKVKVDGLPPDVVLQGAVEVTVKDGKITSFTFTLDDETLEKLGGTPLPAETVGSPAASTT